MGRDGGKGVLLFQAVGLILVLFEKVTLKDGGCGMVGATLHSEAQGQLVSRLSKSPHQVASNH